MAKKISLNTIELVLYEADRAVADKSRVTSDISDRKVREIITKCSEHAVKYGISALGIAAGLTITGTVTKAAIGGTIAGGMAAGGGATIGALTAGGTATAFVASGAAAGSALPVVGTVIGAAVGLIVGILIGKGSARKQQNKKEILYQSAIAKQHTIICELKKEVEELQKLVEKKDGQIERLRYLLGVLSAHSELTAALAN